VLRHWEVWMLAFFEFIPQGRCLTCCFCLTTLGCAQACALQRTSQSLGWLSHLCHCTGLTFHNKIFTCLVSKIKVFPPPYYEGIWEEYRCWPTHS
jgi:hypothetical protein